MATATETHEKSGGTAVATAPIRDPGKDKSQEKDESEKDKADKALQERIEREGPSPLRVNPPQSETDRLRAEGIEVVEVATAPLPGEGPANDYGFSAGFPVPREEAIDRRLVSQKEEREEKEKKQGEDGRKQKQEEREKRVKEGDKSAGDKSKQHQPAGK
jgi:hypothetical protein